MGAPARRVCDAYLSPPGIWCFLRQAEGSAESSFGMASERESGASPKSERQSRDRLHSDFTAHVVTISCPH